MNAIIALVARLVLSTTKKIVVEGAMPMEQKVKILSIAAVDVRTEDFSRTMQEIAPETARLEGTGRA